MEVTVCNRYRKVYYLHMIIMTNVNIYYWICEIDKVLAC